MSCDDRFCIVLISLNRYAYAGNNPEAVIDPDGHSGWGWLTGALSSAASDVSNVASTAASDIVSVATNPETQTIVATAAVDVGAGAAIAVTGGAILATPAGGALLGAAVSATSYEATTLLTGGQTNLGTWAISTGSGAALGAVTAGVGELFAGGGEAALMLATWLTD